MKKHYFDLIVPIGEDCACSSYLRDHSLQLLAYPFDWLTKASFDKRIELLANGFSDFMEKEDFVFLPKPTQGDTDKYCDYYHNTRTDFYFYHDFPTGENFNIIFQTVAAKYFRRIERLYKHITSAEHILFSRDKTITKEKAKRAVEVLRQAFPGKKEVCLLIVENKPSALHIESKNYDGIFFYRYNMFSANKHTPLSIVKGNTRLAGQVFRQFKLKKTLGFHALNWITNCLPYTKIKKHLRKKVAEYLLDRR